MSVWLKTLFPTVDTIGIEGNAALLSILASNVDAAHIVDLNQPRPDLALLTPVLQTFWSIPSTSDNSSPT